jgi:hypothetical protein
MAEMRSFGSEVLRSPVVASSYTTIELTHEATVTSGGRNGIRTMSVWSFASTGGGLKERAIGRKCNLKICGRSGRPQR